MPKSNLVGFLLIGEPEYADAFTVKWYYAVFSNWHYLPYK